MSDQRATYERVMARFTALVDGIGDGQWDAATPCEGWTVRDLLEHVVVRDDRIAATLGGAPFVEGAVPADLRAAWHERAGWWAQRLADPATADAVWPTYFGELTLAQAVFRMMTGEIVIHTWDLARALGADEALDPGAVQEAYGEIRSHGDALRGPGAMGPEVAVADGADLQTRLLAFTGRAV
jgi:uncharacterized protein (TIGR03086 family)